MTRAAAEQMSQTDRLHNRADLRDALPAVALLMVGQGALIVLDPPKGASFGNIAWSLVSAAGILWLAWSHVRSLRRADEYQRIMKLEALAIAFGVVMVLVFGAGFLEAIDVGDPRQSLQVITTAGALTWTVALGLKTRRAR